jgi:hypothetical protein
MYLFERLYICCVLIVLLQPWHLLREYSKMGITPIMCANILAASQKYPTSRPKIASVL